MPRGTVTAFDAARGSGTVLLETGDALHFDVSLTTARVHLGATAEVVTGIGRGGQLIARLVLVDHQGGDAQPFAQGFDALRQMGLLSEWTLDDAAAAAGGPQLTRQLAGQLLLTYYGSKSIGPRGRADRVAYLDEHFGDDPVIPVDDLVAFAPADAQPALRQAVASLHPFSLGSVLAAFNGALQQLGLASHYYLLDAGSDRYVVVVLREDHRPPTGSVLRVVT